ncbi:hypothetical protein LROSL1_1174 [Furfurilactobacillus rossiae]|uniref:YopX family protein n=1 Tax=Furfurilactobacillus rossiae TaxID=231049 RepID=UPI0015BB03C6|nr:YopX family protein [Furfurilactobacillus rossiae]QLE63991.1 hypothetical protein LROSL1_1174 [Furfurilactobacillus rossiae]
MREIKFKAISELSEQQMNESGVPHKGKFVVGMYNDGYMLDGTADADDDYYTPEVWCAVKSATVSEYTGRQDFNHVEAYENDIVSLFHDNLGDPESLMGVIELCDGQWIVHNYRHKRTLPLYQETMGLLSYGSKFDHPELLEEVKPSNGDE